MARLLGIGFVVSVKRLSKNCWMSPLPHFTTNEQGGPNKGEQCFKLMITEKSPIKNFKTLVKVLVTGWKIWLIIFIAGTVGRPTSRKKTKDQVLEKKLEHADRVKSGNIITFTDWQLINTELTGQCIAFLP